MNETLNNPILELSNIITMLSFSSNSIDFTTTSESVHKSALAYLPLIQMTKELTPQSQMYLNFIIIRPILNLAQHFS